MSEINDLQAQKPAENHPRSPRAARIELTCHDCGASYLRTEAELRVKPSRFCSKRCFYAAKRTGEQHECRRCGDVFYRKASETAAYCSDACCRAARAAIATSYPKIGARHAHRVIAEQKVGRELLPGEVVHHLDENKRNCDPENLEVLPSQAEHTRMHFAGKRQSITHVRRRVESRRRTMEAQS